MAHKFGIPAILALVICAAAILATTSSTPKEAYEFDAGSKTIVIFANVQPLPGPPLPSCPHVPIPVLRIWGDGLTYINNQMHDQNAINYAGVLKPEQISDQLSFLDRQGFFNGIDLGGVNPAGTWIEMGANLATTSVKYTGGVDLWPKLLAQLIDRMTPYLQPLYLINPLDERITAAQSLWNRPCN